MDHFSNFPAIPHRICENRDIWISPNRVCAEWMRWVSPWRSSALCSSVRTEWAGENTRVIHLRMKMRTMRMHTYSYIYISEYRAQFDWFSKYCSSLSNGFTVNKRIWSVNIHLFSNGLSWYFQWGFKLHLMYSLRLQHETEKNKYC